MFSFWMNQQGKVTEVFETYDCPRERTAKLTYWVQKIEKRTSFTKFLNYFHGLIKGYQ